MKSIENSIGIFGAGALDAAPPVLYSGISHFTKENSVLVVSVCFKLCLFYL